MFKAKKRGFTLIELLVVIAIIGILATLAVVALQQARQNARDSKRMADMKQLQTALELFFNENGRYPTTEEWNSGSIISSSTGELFMYSIPTAPTPADGSCLSASNSYTYIPAVDGSTYTIDFCTGKQVSDLPEGVKQMTPGGIIFGANNINDDSGGDSGLIEGLTFYSLLSPEVYLKKSFTSMDIANGSGKFFITGSGYWDSPSYIYQSSNLSSWSKIDSAQDRLWRGISSSFDGNNVVAIVKNGYIYTSSDSGVNWVERQAAGSRTWISVDSSSDGSIIMASSSDGVYLSNDYGSSWTKVINVSSNWRSVSVSSSGDVLIAVGGSIYISVDSGDNWSTKSLSQNNWVSSCMSDDGSKMIVSDQVGIFVSSDYGNSWSAAGVLPQDSLSLYSSVDISSDGSYLIFAGHGYDHDFGQTYRGGVYLSLDFGQSWADISPSMEMETSWHQVKISSSGDKIMVIAPRHNLVYFSGDLGQNWTEKRIDKDRVAINLSGSSSLQKISAINEYGDILNSSNYGNNLSMSNKTIDASCGKISSSSDGSRMVTCSRYGYIYTSSDSGRNWEPITSLGVKPWKDITSSSNGSIIVALENMNGYIYISNDYGASWIEKTNLVRNWSFVDSSADGSKIVAAANGSYIYTSNDYGNTWTERSQSGSSWWNYLSCSLDDCSKIIAVSDDDVLISSNSGASWSSVDYFSDPYLVTSVSMSSDASVIVVNSDGFVYTSFDLGNTWRKESSLDSVFWYSSLLSHDGSRFISSYLYSPPLGG